MGDYSKYLSHAQVYRNTDAPSPDAQVNLRVWAQEIYDPLLKLAGSDRGYGWHAIQRGPRVRGLRRPDSRVSCPTRTRPWTAPPG